MAELNSTRLATESKTFTTNASRTPETSALIVRALKQYAENMSHWLENNNSTVLTPAWAMCYDEWRAVVTTLKALGVELP